jgi:hypothetical protein
MSESTAPSYNFEKFKRLFRKAYNQWYRRRVDIDKELLDQISSQKIPVSDFKKLTLPLEGQRYIALIDGSIRFDYIPNSPHGELIYRLSTNIWRQLEKEGVLYGCGDNGVIFFLNYCIFTD